MLFKKIYYKLFKDKAERKDLKKIDLLQDMKKSNTLRGSQRYVTK